MEYRILPMGDCAFTVEYPDLSGVKGASHIRTVHDLIEQQMDAGELIGIVDLISASRSLTICVDPTICNLSGLIDQLSSHLSVSLSKNKNKSCIWQLPACYDPKFGEDLEELAGNTKLSIDEIIQIHSNKVYDVLLIGFLPGFPFMAEVDERLQFPRRETPRTQVPAGSVAIANNQTAIYPWESPGGWHLLGRCPIPLFNANWEVPSLLRPGDKVKFSSISSDQYGEINEQIESEKFNYETLMLEAD